MKVKRIVATALLLCWSWAAGQDYALGVRAQAMGGSGVAFASDPEGQALNPALLAGLQAWGVTAFYSHPFGIREIGLSSLSLSGRLGQMAGGAVLVRLGHENFEDQLYQFALAYSLFHQRKYSRQPDFGVAFGLQAALRRIHIPNYGQAHAIIVNLGTVARWGEHFQWGAKVGNLLNAKLGAAHEPLPRELSLGLGYMPRIGAVFQLDVYKESDFPLEVRGGVEYRVLAPLFLRLGISSNPDRLTCGVAVWLRPMVLHATAFSHTDLGWTQQYGITLQK